MFLALRFSCSAAVSVFAKRVNIVFQKRLIENDHVIMLPLDNEFSAAMFQFRLGEGPHD